MSRTTKKPAKKAKAKTTPRKKPAAKSKATGRKAAPKKTASKKRKGGGAATAVNDSGLTPKQEALQEFLDLGRYSGQVIVKRHDRALAIMSASDAQDAIVRLVEAEDGLDPDDAANEKAGQLLAAGAVRADPRDLAIELVESYWRGVHQAARVEYKAITSADHQVVSKNHKIPLAARSGPIGRMLRALRD